MWSYKGKRESYNFISQFQFETWNNNLHILQLLTRWDNSSSNPTARIVKGVKNAHFRPTYIKPSHLRPFWRENGLDRVRSLPRNTGPWFTTLLTWCPPPTLQTCCMWICCVNDDYKISTSQVVVAKWTIFMWSNVHFVRKSHQKRGINDWRIPNPAIQERILEWCYVCSLWIIFFSWSNDNYKTWHCQKTTWPP